MTMDACISSAKRCASVASFASRHLVEEALTDNVYVVGVVATVTADVVVSVAEATGVVEEVVADEAVVVAVSSTPHVKPRRLASSSLISSKNC